MQPSANLAPRRAPCKFSLYVARLAFCGLCMAAVQAKTRPLLPDVHIDPSFFDNVLRKGGQGAVSFSPGGSGTPTWVEKKEGQRFVPRSGVPRSPGLSFVPGGGQRSSDSVVPPFKRFVPGKPQSTNSTGSPPVTPVTQEDAAMQPRLGRASTYPGVSQPKSSTQETESKQGQKKRRGRRNRGVPAQPAHPFLSFYDMLRLCFISHGRINSCHTSSVAFVAPQAAGMLRSRAQPAARAKQRARTGPL